MGEERRSILRARERIKLYSAIYASVYCSAAIYASNYCSAAARTKSNQAIEHNLTAYTSAIRLFLSDL